MNQTYRSTEILEKDLSLIPFNSDESLIKFNDDSDNEALNDSQQNFNQSYESLKPHSFLADEDMSLIDSMELINYNYGQNKQQKKKALQNDHPNVTNSNNALFQQYQISTQVQGQNQQQFQQKVNQQKLILQDDVNYLDYCFFCAQKIEITKLFEHEKACQQLYYVQEEVDDNDFQTFGRQKIVKQKQQEINSFCSYCKVKLNILELNEHEQQCQARLEIEYSDIRCPFCGDAVIRSFINDHLEECVQCIEDKFKKLDNIQECSICMVEITEKEMEKKLKCEHVFHKSCIQTWFSIKQDCPICRKKNCK